MFKSKYNGLSIDATLDAVGDLEEAFAGGEFTDDASQKVLTWSSSTSTTSWFLTFELPYATTSKAGVMSAADKNKLDSLSTQNTISNEMLARTVGLPINIAANSGQVTILSDVMIFSDTKIKVVVDSSDGSFPIGLSGLGAAEMVTQSQNTNSLEFNKDGKFNIVTYVGGTAFSGTLFIR